MYAAKVFYSYLILFLFYFLNYVLNIKQHTVIDERLMNVEHSNLIQLGLIFNEIQMQKHSSPASLLIDEGIKGGDNYSSEYEPAEHYKGLVPGAGTSVYSDFHSLQFTEARASRNSLEPTPYLKKVLRNFG